MLAGLRGSGRQLAKAPLFVALVAARWLPARRAIRVAPMIAPRSE